jgi:hypothetical protein
MEKNRVFAPINSNIDTFSSFSSFSASSPFIGIDIPGLIETAKRQSFVEGVKKGTEETIKTLDNAIADYIDNFILVNTKIVDFVKSIIEKEKKDSIKLIEARANFHYLTSGLINTLFIIETDIENELWFVQLLSSLSKKVLEEYKYIAEIRFINKKGKELEEGFINSEFPAQRSFH